MLERDYYKVLGVSSNASVREIKQAYRELARRYHPDLNPDDEQAETRFKEINEAYAVLSDGEKRARYDRFGTITPQPKRTPGGGAHSAPRSHAESKRGVFSEFLNALFGDTAHPRTASNKTPIRGFDVDVHVSISLDQAYTGTVCKITSDETGREFSAHIPAGAKTGTRVRFGGQGKRGFAGGERGDLYVVVKVHDHPVFDRDGEDLHVDLKIDLYTAVLGGEAIISTLSGDVVLKVPAGTQSGSRIRLLGKGMPRLRNPKEFGDLFVRPLIQVPTNLSDTQLELFEHLRSLHRSSNP